MLSKFISLAFWYNKLEKKFNSESVVICFQNLYLWLSDTTFIHGGQNNRPLWFAFKIYIFGFLIQLCIRMKCFPVVVICFQNLYLWLSDTTDLGGDRIGSGLWFAFKIYIFGFLIQHTKDITVKYYGCDLLSKFISLAFWYNSDYDPRNVQ